MDRLIIIIGNIVWGPHMLLLLVGIGVYFTLRLKFIQLTGLKSALKYSFKQKVEKPVTGSGKGDVNSYEALMMMLGGAIGNGNIAGVATAIAIGGPGAVFWMWISAFFGMASSYAESVLGVKYRQVNDDGTILSGPMYYIKHGLGWGWLAVTFAFFMGIKTLFGTTTIQVNSMSLVVNKLFDVPMIVTGLVVAVLTWLVIIRGVERIAKISSKLIPFMVMAYLLSALVVISLKINEIPAILMDIVHSAFNAKSAGGGFAGASVMMAMRFGIARGVYSNEAGTGSAPIVHGAAIVQSPAEQGKVSMIGVLVDTLVINTLTALVILSAANWATSGTSTVLAASSFESGLGIAGAWIVALSSLLFGYSTLITWPYYGEQCFVYLFGNGIRVPFRWTFCIVMLCGTMKEAEVIWAFGDILNGMMAIPNLIAIVALGGVVMKLSTGNSKNDII